MKKEDKIYLNHMKEACQYIIKFTKEINKIKFNKDRLYQDAIIREIIIIGEAANKISAETQNEYYNILWKDIIGMRNIIIHDYFGIDLDAVWKTATVDIPKLYKELENIS